MRRFLAVFIVFSLFAFSIFPEDEFSQEIGQEGIEQVLQEETSESGDDDDFESLFGEDDIEVEQNENTDASQKTGLDKVLSENLALPLRFSGSLESSIGGYFNYLIGPGDGHEQEELKDYLSGYFTLSNDLFLTARIDSSLSFRARINTSFPGNNTILSFKELYCDYLFLDKVYITLGRKISAWGYTRIFSSGDTYKNEKVLTDGDVSDAIESIENEGFLHTDILHDTADSISAMIRIPLWTGMISTIFYYDMAKGNTYPSFEDLRIALSIEMTVFNTTINLFGKKYSKEERNHITMPSYPLAGIELKRTCLGFDVYAQFIATLQDWKAFNMQKNFMTVGFYRLWDKFIPNVGFNVEYQQSYDYDNEFERNRIAVDFGLKKMGKNNDLKFGLNWQHKFREHEGTVKALFVKGGVWRHCDWENALEYRYNEPESKSKAKFQFVTSLKIKVDY